MLDESLKGKNIIIIETFDEEAYVFDVIEKGNRYFLKLDIFEKLIQQLVIKPNFLVSSEDGFHYDLKEILKKRGEEPTYIKNCYIDPTLLQKLAEKYVITYTIGTADMYDLPHEYAKDYEYHYNDYSRKNSKEKVLTKLKSGIFN